MFAMTIDQRRSRDNPDAVPELLEALNTHRLVRRFERTAGDEVQGLIDDPGVAVDLVAAVASRGSWWVGIGIGEVETPIPRSVRESRGPALVFARAAVERAPKSSSGVAVSGEDVVYAETAVQALAGIIAERSPEGHQAVAALQRSTSQRQAAQLLGISAQAISSRLRVARWADEQRMRELAVHLMTQVESRTQTAVENGD